MIGNTTPIFFRKAVIILFTLCTSISAYSQQVPQVAEQKIRVLFDSLYRYTNYDYDRSSHTDSAIEDMLLAALSDPASVDYPFDSITGSVTIASSPDRRLRFFSWNTTLGGTMQDVTILAQYRGVDGSIHAKNVKLNSHQDNGDGMEQGPFDQAISFSQVFRFTQDRFIISAMGKYSSKDVCNSLCNFEIKGNDLIDSNRIFYVDATPSSIIVNCYNFFEQVPVSAEMAYDTIKKIIHYTEVVSDDMKSKNVKVRKVILHFDGKVFRKKRLK